jgi:hypothetical protein
VAGRNWAPQEICIDQTPMRPFRREPSHPQTQVERADSLARELADVVKVFDA